MAKDTYYFSHDYNARHDEKIKKLIRRHKMEGYGVFWAIVEDLYNNANALRTDYEGIAFDLHTNPELVKSVVEDFDLFIIDKDCFGSMSAQRRIDERNEKSTKARESAYKRWNKEEVNANALRTDYEGNAINKGKERNKRKEIKENKFYLFWNLYDKKVSRDKSEKKWNSLSVQDQTKIIEITPQYIAWKSDKQFRPDPLTFLNGKRWEDEIPKVFTKSTERLKTQADFWNSQDYEKYCEKNNIKLN